MAGSRHTMILALAVAISFGGCIQPKSSANHEPNQLPEFFLARRDTPHCVLRVQIPGNDRTKRHTNLLDFFDKAYTATSEWKILFIPIVVDYLDYSFLHVVLFKACSPQTLSQSKRELAKLLGSSPQVEIRPDRTFVGLASERFSFASTASFFRAYGTKYTVVDCAVRLREPDSGLRNQQYIQDALNRIWAKYRLSIAEVWQVNEYTYIIFSRQCQNKKVLYDQLQQLAEREGQPLKSFVASPDFSPDLTEYYESHGGLDEKEK